MKFAGVPETCNVNPAFLAMIYFAVNTVKNIFGGTYHYSANRMLQVAISRDKKKLRRYVSRNPQFTGKGLVLGVCNRNAFSSPEAYWEKFGRLFGPCSIYDVDQRLVFASDFSVIERF